MQTTAGGRWAAAWDVELAEDGLVELCPRNESAGSAGCWLALTAAGWVLLGLPTGGARLVLLVAVSLVWLLMLDLPAELLRAGRSLLLGSPSVVVTRRTIEIGGRHSLPLHSVPLHSVEQVDVVGWPPLARVVLHVDGSETTGSADVALRLPRRLHGGATAVADWLAHLSGPTAPLP